MLKKLMSIVIGASALMAPTAMSAAEPAVADECAKELLLSYFPEPIVTETLKRFAIPQDKVNGIVKSLSSKDKDVVRLVEEKAAAMNPNPLKDPQQRQAAVKLFRDTLLQVFTDGLKENGVTDTSKFQAMLDDIQQQKAKKFAMCMERQKNQASTSQDDEDDGDDEDDDDEDDEDDNDNKDGEKKDSDKAKTDLKVDIKKN